MTAKDDRSDGDWRDARLADLELSIRTLNCLSQAGLTTVGELVRMTDAELLRTRNFGPVRLNKVKSLVCSADELAPGGETRGNRQKLDFNQVEEPLLSKLFRPVRSLRLRTRAKHALLEKKILMIGDLIQLSESDLFLRTPHIGRMSINDFRQILAEIGLSLGTTIANWPKSRDLALILESRPQSPSQQQKTNIGTFEFLEDELFAAVQMSVDSDWHPIVMRRTGWDGGEILTLKGLANHPLASDLKSTGQSINTIRYRHRMSLRSIEQKAWRMPMLERAVSLIKENAPLTAANVRNLLALHQITRSHLGFDALKSAVKTFEVEWNLICRFIGPELFLLPTAKADTIESLWTYMLDVANRRDFVKLHWIECADGRAIDFAPDIERLLSSTSSEMAWLDRERRIYWSLKRANYGRNKSLRVCRKILTAVPAVDFGELYMAVSRTNTVTDYPTREMLMGMVVAAGDFVVCDELVSRSKNFNPVVLGKNDQLVINAAKEVGTVTTFRKLRDVLLCAGCSANNAGALILASPFWTRTTDGGLKFISDEK